MQNSNLDRWPRNAAGEPEPKALLGTETDLPGDLAIFCSMLESFGIPYFARRKGSGEYINLLSGRSLTSGVEIFVPASQLEEIKALLAAPPIFDEDPTDLLGPQA